MDHTRTDHSVHERPRHAAVLGGRYELAGLLGRGGMSEVYRAQDQMMQREVAVKVLRAHGSDDTMALRMSQEARIVAAVDHPHLVRVHDAGCEDGQCYLVMELVDGGTLGDLVERGPMPAELAARIGAQLAQALGAIHAAGFVHRDIKPANVLLARATDPADVSARLTDFGIARMVDGTRLTSTGLMLGTAPYLSPEQVLGTLVSYPSDVYALGLLLLECRTAAQAYPGPAVESAVARLHRQPDVPADLGPAWVTLLTAMTAREPADRPTAEQVAAGLSELAEGRAPAAEAGRPGAPAAEAGRPGAPAAEAAGPGAPEAEPVGEPARPGRRAGRAHPVPGAAGRASRGTHATHPGSRGPEGEAAARHPLRGARRLLGAAAAAAAVFTTAALISGGSSPFRSERPPASQPAQHHSAATSGATSRSGASSAGARTANAGTVRLAGSVSGSAVSIEQAARTSSSSTGAPSTPGGSASSSAGSGSTPASASSSSHSATGASSSSAPTTGTNGTPGAKSSHAVPGSSKGNGHGNGNSGKGRGNGHGAGHSPASGGPGGISGAPPSSASTPTTSEPTSTDPPSSSDPSSSPTGSPTSTPDPAVSTSDPTQNPHASASASSSTTGESTTGN